MFSPDGACLLVSDGRPSFLLSVDVANRTVVTSLSSLQAQAVEFVPNNANNIILAADLTNNEIHVLTLSAGCALTEGTPVATPGTGPRNIAALPNGQIALVAHNDGTIGVLSINGSSVSFSTSFIIGGNTASAALRAQGLFCRTAARPMLTSVALEMSSC